MPPLAIPPLLALAAVGATFVGRWALREYRRVNAELDELRPGGDTANRTQTLRRDPVTGEYRP
jgi:hypothetical protein